MQWKKQENISPFFNCLGISVWKTCERLFLNAFTLKLQTQLIALELSNINMTTRECVVFPDKYGSSPPCDKDIVICSVYCQRRRRQTLADPDSAVVWFLQSAVEPWSRGAAVGVAGFAVRLPSADTRPRRWVMKLSTSEPTHWLCCRHQPAGRSLHST